MKWARFSPTGSEGMSNNSVLNPISIRLGLISLKFKKIPTNLSVQIYLMQTAFNFYHSSLRMVPTLQLQVLEISVDCANFLPQLIAYLLSRHQTVITLKAQGLSMPVYLNLITVLSKFYHDFTQTFFKIKSGLNFDEVSFARNDFIQVLF